MKFRDLEIGQSFKFTRSNDDRVHTRTGPGNFMTGNAKVQGYLGKWQRNHGVEPVGEPPAPEPRDPSQEDLQDLLRIARVELLSPSLDRDTILAAILTTLEVLVKKS